MVKENFVVLFVLLGNEKIANRKNAQIMADIWAAMTGQNNSNGKAK